jgi:hypothetical protein
MGEVINQTFFQTAQLAVDPPDPAERAVASAPPTRGEPTSRATTRHHRARFDPIWEGRIPAAEYKARPRRSWSKSVVNGVRCDHVAFRNAEVDWQVWIQEGANPLPRKFVVTSKNMPESPQFVVVLSTWDAAPKLDDSTFTFVPPKGSQEIDFISASPSPVVATSDGKQP